MANDVEAGRAFVTLYVRDRVFRQQLAEDGQLYQQSLAPPAVEAGENPHLDQLADSIQGYELLGQTADDSMGQVYEDTMALAEQTERLNDALQEVMSSYEDLAGMQEEGITLSFGGGGGAGTDQEGWLDTGEVEHTLESGVVGAMGRELGSKAMSNMLKTRAGEVFDKLTKNVSERFLGKLKDSAGDAAEALGNKAIDVGQKLLSGPGMGAVAAATKGADVVMAELVPAAKATGVVMAELVPAAEAATTATAGLGATLAGLAPMAAAAAVAAAVLVPVLALIDETTGGTLAESGYYPEWLKRIGDAMLYFTPLGTALKVIVDVFKQLWSVVTELYEAFSNISAILIGPAKLAVGAITTAVSVALKVAFFPLHAALLAFNAPFRAFHLAVDSVKAVFNTAQAAVVKFVDGIRALPGLAASAAASMAKLAQSMASATWNAYANTIHSISAGLQSAGKTMAIVGGGMAALGAVIVTPLAKAAETFSSHGKEVSEIAEKYEISAEAAATYAYMASQTGRSVKDLTSVVKEDTEEFAKWNMIAAASGWTIGDSAKGAVSLAHAYKEAKDALHGLWVQLGRAVAPAVEESTRLFAGAVRIVTDWVRNNQALIATAFRVASTIAAVGSALAAAGGVLITVGAAMTPFTVALAGIAGGLALVEYKTKVGASLWNTYKESLVNVFGKVMSAVQPVIAHVQRVVQGVKDAVMGGKIGLVFEIVVNEVKAIWAGGLAWLADKTGGVFGDILADLGAGDWQGAADAAMGMVTAAFWRGMDTLDEIWTWLENTVDEAFDYLVSVADEAWGKIQDAADPAWLWLQDMFAELKTTAQDVFAEVGVLAAGLGAAFSDVAGKLKLILIGLAATNPAMAAMAYSAVKTIGMIEGSAVSAYQTAVDEARDKLGSGGGDFGDQESERDKQLADRKNERDNARAARGADRERASEERRGARTEAELVRSGDRGEAIAGAEKMGRSPGAVALAQASAAQAAADRDEAIEKARKAREDMNTPPDPKDKDKEKAKSYSGFTTTSAYAFGQFGSNDPARSQLEEMKKSREEAKDERKQRDKDWAELLRWQKILGTRNPDETRAAMFDLMS